MARVLAALVHHSLNAAMEAGIHAVARHASGCLAQAVALPSVSQALVPCLPPDLAGPNGNLSDPVAIFVFRYGKSEGGVEKPMVYHMNMMRPRSYLLAQKFMLNDKGVVYIGGAAANRPTKLLRIVSAIFTPFLLGRQLAD